MATIQSELLLRVSWDHAVLALEHAIAQGRHRFAVLDRDNGYMRIREDGGVTLDIEIRVEASDATRIIFLHRRRWLGFHAPGEAQVNAVMQGLREDVIIQLRRELEAA